MTNELEKQFFDTFGIEPRDNFKGCENGITFYTYGCNMPSCKGCLKEIREKEYPQITDRILLELIVLHSVWCMPRLCCFNVEQLKEQVLSDLTLFNDKRIELIHQVRTLFEEG